MEVPILQLKLHTGIVDFTVLGAVGLHVYVWCMHVLRYMYLFQGVDAGKHACAYACFLYVCVHSGIENIGASRCDYVNRTVCRMAESPPIPKPQTRLRA